MESLTVKKNEMLQKMAAMELHPAVIEEEVSLTNCTKLPWSRVTALGIAFEPVVSAFQSIVNDGATSGLYKVTVPAGGHLAEFRDGRGYLGSVLNAKDQVSGQATLNPLVFNPTMLFMAAALANIDKKLVSIQETQQEILDFLVQKDKSELKGDLNFLSDVMNNYKYNWNNEKYINSNHFKVLDIKQSAEQKIIFYREQISKDIDRKAFFFHSDQDVKKQLEKIESAFKDYQLALYLYSFSSFLEVMLLENFEVAFLDCIVGKIEDYSFKYREFYTKCYDQIEGYSKSSIQSNFLSGLSIASRAAGKAIEKVPVINKSQIDESLIKTGDKIGDFSSKRTVKTMQTLVDKQNSYVTPFVENIKAVNRLYNRPLKIVFDRENLYLEATE